MASSSLIAGVGFLLEGWEGSRRNILRSIARRESLGGYWDNRLGVSVAVILTIVVFLVAGLVHVLWWSDHLIRMIQLYLSLTVSSLFFIGMTVMEKMEGWLLQDPTFLSNLDQYR